MLESQDTLDKIGFNIGWDFFVYSMSLPDNANGHPKIYEGYKAASERASKRKNDRFDRKCLVLRLNAFVRGKAFDERITPEYIKEIDNQYCPITKVLLTHGTQEDTDWSVDRILNDAGYTIGNLVVVSTRANKIKGSRNFYQISEIVASLRLNPQQDYGLNLYEWIRWQAICSKVLPYQTVKENKAFKRVDNCEYDIGDDGFVFVISPCVIQPLPGLFFLLSDILQVIIANKAYGQHEVKHVVMDLQKKFEGKAKIEFEKILKIAQKVAAKTISTSTLDIWYNQNLFEKYSDFYLTYCLQNPIVREALNKLTKGGDTSTKPQAGLLVDMDIKEWHVETKGYINRT